MRALRAGTVAAMALAVTFGACAADPGDPPKTEAGAPSQESFDDAGTPVTSGSGADASSAENNAADAFTASGEGTQDASTNVPEKAEAAPPPSTEASASPPPGDGGCDLTNVPSTCPDCMTQNASDQPICKQYLACFATNGCDPTTSCGSNTGVCGVNTIGGGEAPYTAAVATYMCACP